jgi:hypothetical protein
MKFKVEVMATWKETYYVEADNLENASYIVTELDGGTMVHGELEGTMKPHFVEEIAEFPERALTLMEMEEQSG